MASVSIEGAKDFKATEPYRYYVVFTLCIVYMFNMLDRTLLNPLGEPIKREFGLSDAQLGLLTGLTFAMFYTTLGVVLARVADRHHRVNLISISIAVWSLFTGLSGLAKTFAHLFIARVGVGIGEAGCNPAAYSLISDYFPVNRRATALAIYHMGGSIGVFAGFILAALVADNYGWRACFYIVGIPGLIVALIVWLTIREPPRGFSDPGKLQLEAPPFLQVLRQLMKKKTFWHIAAGCALTNFTIYGVGFFQSNFLIRTHELSVSQAAYTLAFVNLAGGIFGTFVAGLVTDKLSARRGDPRFYLWVPAVSGILGLPFAQIAYGISDTNVAIAALVPTAILALGYLSPSIAATYRLVGVRERALAGAVLLLILNFIGLGFGPPIAGKISDMLNAYFLSQGVAPVQAEADGLRWTMRILPFLGLWSVFHFFMAARTLRQESLPDTAAVNK